MSSDASYASARPNPVGLGHGSPGDIGLLSDGTVMLWLTVSTAITVPLALVSFSWFVTRARQAGLLDMTTGS